MDLSEILSITGKPGLYKVVTQAKNGIIVQPLIDGKRFTAFSNEQISSLEEISIFSETEDIPLKDVFKSLFDKFEGKVGVSHKADGKLLKATFEEVVPDYDSERVYVSDIKKVIQWYNLLAEKEMLNFDEEVEEEKVEEEKVEEEKVEETSEETEKKASAEKENKE